MTPAARCASVRRRLPRDQWEVLIPDHHPGFTDWDTYLANQARIGTNIRPQARQPGTGAVREGCALLQGLATCGTCGRKLAVFYAGPAKCVPNYYCHGSGRAGRRPRRPAHERRRAGHRRRRRRRVPGRAGSRPRCRPAWQPPSSSKHGHDAALDQHRRQVEQARYHATRAERRYRAVDPDNRLVARGLEAEWETALRELADAETELARRQAARPEDPHRTANAPRSWPSATTSAPVWDAPTTTDKDRKQLLRTLLDEVNITLRRDDPGPHAALVLRWKGGAISELTVPLRRRQPAIRTDEDTIDLIRRLAVHYPDAMIAGILNRQHRRTARGLSYTASRVQSLPLPLAHPLPPARRQRPDPRRRTAQRDRRRPPARHRAVHPAALAQRRLHRRRADHPRRALAHPPHRSAPRHAHRHRPRRLGPPRLRHPGARRLPPDRIAEGQARRAARRPDPHRTQERPAYRATQPRKTACSNRTISKGAV